MPPGLPGLAMPEPAAPSVSAASAIAAVKDHPKVLRNSRETLTGREDKWKPKPSTADEVFVRKVGRLGRDDCFYTFAVRKWVIVFSFVLGLAATTAAVALATGPGDERRGGEVVTSVDQLRGVGFVSSCAFSHRAPDDPIVYRRPGSRAHSHGSHRRVLDGRDAEGGRTTCKRRGETAAYWVPTLVSGAQASFRCRLRLLPARHDREVKPFPPDLRMIAGSSVATSPQPLSVTRWDCGIEANVAGSSDPPTCPPGPRTAFRLHVSFPDCWDGQNLDTTDHHSHIAYAVEGHCPPSHPVAVPALELILRYPVLKGPSC